MGHTLMAIRDSIAYNRMMGRVPAVVWLAALTIMAATPKLPANAGSASQQEVDALDREKNCGPISLRILSVLLGCPIYQKSLTDSIPLDEYGCSMLDLVCAGSKHGLHLTCRQHRGRSLGDAPLPCIVLLKAKDPSVDIGHFVVVLGNQGGETVFADPSYSDLQRLPTAEFNQLFSGYSLAKYPHPLAELLSSWYAFLALAAVAVLVTWTAKQPGRRERTGKLTTAANAVVLFCCSLLVGCGERQASPNLLQSAYPSAAICQWRSTDLEIAPGQSIDLGFIPIGDPGTFAAFFELGNYSSDSMPISLVGSSCDCVAAELVTNSVLPGTTEVVIVRIERTGAGPQAGEAFIRVPTGRLGLRASAIFEGLIIRDAVVDDASDETDHALQLDGFVYWSGTDDYNRFQLKSAAVAPFAHSVSMNDLEAAEWAPVGITGFDFAEGRAFGGYVASKLRLRLDRDALRQVEKGRLLCRVDYQIGGHDATSLSVLRNLP